MGTTQTSCFIQGISGITTGLAAIPVLVDANGQLGTVSSSIRYKNSVMDMGNDSSDILKLRPVTFILNDDESKTKQYGLIAEEVELIKKDLVYYKDDKPESVLYQNLVPMLLNEQIKQKEENEEDKKTIANLTSHILALEEKYENIITNLTNRILALEQK
jgi:hypothetical protein